MKVNIIDWHGFATWHWNVDPDDTATSTLVDELCGICRVSFDGTCPNCKYPGDECPIVLGSGCTHNFHLHCILKWLEQETSKGLCPMCRQIFTSKPSCVGNAEELQNLENLIYGHKSLRENVQNTSQQEFDPFEEG